MEACLRTKNTRWDKLSAVFILRAAQFLEPFRGVTDLKISLPVPPEETARAIQESLNFRKRKIVLHYGAVLPENTPLFAAPDLAVLLDGKREEIGIPEIPGLTDFHVHTPLAYCSENMDIAEAITVEKLSGVKQVHFAEHSGQLYSSAERYWDNLFRWGSRDPSEERTDDYRRMIRGSASLPCRFGLELDVDEDGQISDLPDLKGFRLGAIHFLTKNSSYEEKKKEYLFRLDALLASGIDILAHPFRIFSWSGLPVPKELFRPVADRLIASHTAAEINFHVNCPQPEFVEMLLKKGGKISFGTDSHNLYEAGFLRPHYEFCHTLGIEGKLEHLLLSAETACPKRSGASVPSDC